MTLTLKETKGKTGTLQNFEGLFGHVVPHARVVGKSATVYTRDSSVVLDRMLPSLYWLRIGRLRADFMSKQSRHSEVRTLLPIRR